MYEIPFHKKSLSSYSFLVTGGAGFIGSHIVEYLLKYGAKKVRVLDNLLTGSRKNVELFLPNPAYEFMEGDIREMKDCDAGCAGIDYIFHEAALGSVQRSFRDPMTTHAINSDGFLNILWAAGKAKVKRIIYASSSLVYGDHPALPKTENRTGKPLSPYAVSKHSNELYANVFADRFRMELIGLRYFNIFGPRQSPEGPYAAVIPAFIRDLKEGIAPVIYGDGSQSRDFTFVENAVQANILAMITQNPYSLGQVYNVAMGSRYTILLLCETIGKLLETEVTPLFKSTREGDIVHSIADISKAKKLLSYEPTISLEEGLRILLNQDIKV